MKREWTVTLDVLGGDLGVGIDTEAAGPQKFKIIAPSPSEAIAAAEKSLAQAIEKTGVKDWKVVRAVANAVEDFEPPHIPGLVGVTELSKILKVSRQRASELAKSANFPKPVAVLASTPVWVESTVKQFMDRWQRTPGRPRKSPEPVPVKRPASPKPAATKKPAARKTTTAKKPAARKPAAKKSS